MERLVVACKVGGMVITSRSIASDVGNNAKEPPRFSTQWLYPVDLTISVTTVTRIYNIKYDKRIYFSMTASKSSLSLLSMRQSAIDPAITAFAMEMESSMVSA